MESEIAKLAAAETRLREVIHSIVERRVTREKPLSWRMMFEIEDEAISMLQEDKDLDIRYLNLMASPSAQRRTATEEAAGMSDVYTMHTALWMIQEAYYRAGGRC